MRKRFLSTLLVSAMLATTVLAGCGKTEADSTPTPTAEAAKATDTPTPTEAVAGEALPEAKYYFSLDEKDGTTGITPVQQGSGTVDAVDKEVTFMPGVKGDAVYVNGVTGYKLDINGVGDTYTVSFWMYATRFANYMPTVQFGPDVHGDATGNQHYLNITRTEWNADGATFPCVWSYDQANDGLWPAWSPDEVNEHLKEWMNITIVVDATKRSEDGNCIAADLYVNGQLYGEGISVVDGTMAASDNFDFLLGVNYWDSTFKGAFDEVYVFDTALTAGQALTLYQAGDPTVKYEEPERIIEVTPEEDALESLGTVDYKATFGEAVSQGISLKDGETKKITLHNWSDGLDTKDNYALLFTNGASTAPATDAIATVYADASGTGAAAAESCYTYNWGNWKTWSQSAMVDADVTITLERTGNEISVKADNVDWNATSNLMTATFTVDVADTDTVMVYITAQNAYVDLVSIQDMTVGELTGTVVGATDFSNGWWTTFSDIWAVPSGSSKTFNFKNYTDGVNNWDNFCVVLQKTATGHSATDAEGYGEYAVVRSDNYGWGDGYSTATASCDWNWDTFKTDMYGADVAVTVTNNGETADVVAVVTTTAGTVYTQSYTGITTGGDLYVCFVCEESYLVFDPTIVGATDFSNGWWTTFSDIWAVPANSSKTISFTNYTDGVNNWDNFCVVLQKTATGHSATDAEGYGEYAVVRADNYGWGDGYSTATASCDWNWDTFKTDMYGAEVEVTVTNNGDTADIVAVVTTSAGTVYTQSYTGITTGGDLYTCLVCEESYLVIK